jgi:hypothetical protein
MTQYCTVMNTKVSKTNDDGVKEEVDKQVSLPELMFGAGCV